MSNEKHDQPASSLEFKIMAGALAAISTFAVQKLIRGSWKRITGQEPPDPDDPDASTAETVAWVAASAVGVAVVQVLARRVAANRYATLGRRDSSNEGAKLVKSSSKKARKS